MTNFKDVIDKVHDRKGKVDDDFIYDSLKSISTNTKSIKPLSKNLEKLSKEMKEFRQTFKTSFLQKFNESEKAYESKPQKFGDQIAPSRVGKDGEDKKESGSSWFTKLIGGALLGGIATYFLSDDFKKSVNGIVDGIGETLLGDKDWKVVKDKFKEVSTATTKAIGKFTDNITNFDGLFGKISKGWDEHWKEILLGIAGVSVALDPLGSLAKSIKILNNASELFQTLGGTKAVASIVGGMLTNPLVLGVIMAASLGYLMKEAPKYWSKDYSGVEGLETPTELEPTVTEENIIKRRLEIAEENMRKAESDMLNAKSKDERNTIRNDFIHYKNDVQSLREQLNNIGTPSNVDVSSPKSEANEAKPLTDQERSDNNVKAALKRYQDRQATLNQTTSNEPQRMSIGDYAATYGATYASNDPIPYPVSSKGDNIKTSMDFFMSNGFTKEQAAGIVGNLQVESGNNINPSAVNASGHYGIAQWDGNRRASFMKEMGQSIYGSSLQDQLEFILKELPKNGLSSIQNATTAEEAAKAFERGFERSGGQLMDRRVANANKLVGGDYTSTMESSKNKPTPIPSVPMEYKDKAESPGNEDFMSVLFDKFTKAGYLSAGDVSNIKSNVSKELGEIRNKMENLGGNLLGDLSSNLKGSERASQVAPVINNINHNNQQKQMMGGGDIASPIDIDIAQIMMHTI